MENQTLATEMLKELKANSKRWFISFLVVLVLWFATIGVFIWYLNQPIEETETIEFILKFRDDEEHIYQRLIREKRCGSVERISNNEAIYYAEVWDVHEMLPWVRTFIMRITELHISNKELEEHFWNDVREMKNNYKEMLYDF